MITKVIKKQIGKEAHTFMIEGEDFMDVIRKSQKLSFPNIYKCGVCGSDNLVLGYHKAQEEYEYITVRCRDCKASINFGQQKKDKEMFYLRTKTDGDGNPMKDNKGFPVYDWKTFNQ